MKTHTVPNLTGKRCSYGPTSKPLVQHIALYSLFRKELATGRYIRCRTECFSEKLAIRIWKDICLESAMRAEPYVIRPVKLDFSKVQGITHYRSRSLVS